MWQRTTVRLIELVYTISHHGNGATENTHLVCSCVPLPRRNDPILELFDVGHSGGEDLLEIRYWPSKLTILSVILLQIRIHRHS